MPILPQSTLTAFTSAFVGAAFPVPAGTIWPCLAVGFAGLASWLYLALSRAQQEIKAVQTGHKVLERLHEARDKHLAQQMEAHKAVLRDVKQELAAQRKKNHAAHAALKHAQAELKTEVKRREAAQNERPAFAEVKPRAVTKPEAEPAQPAPQIAAAPAPAQPVETAESLAKTAQLETLKRQQAAQTAALDKAKQAAASHKHDLVRLQRRYEDLRRIDIIGRSKVELLEDKLRGLGRQYYEAISELALLKGEVAPPKPKALAIAPQKPDGDDMTAQVTEPTDEMLRPTMKMASEGEDEDEQDEDHDSADAPTILDDLDSEGESDDGLPIPSDFSSPQQPQA